MTSNNKVEREQRAFWAVSDYQVHHVVGYDCRPSTPDYWWVPELGYSMQAGTSLFEHEQQAIDKALDSIDKAIKNLERLKEKLQ